MSALDRDTGSSPPGSIPQTLTLQTRLQRSPERERLERRARMLAWGGIAYHFVEFARLCRLTFEALMGGSSPGDRASTEAPAYYPAGREVGK
jgi:hypothetical protein